DFAVSATASSGLPVTFTATGGATVALVGGVWTVHITGAGGAMITAHQIGGTFYNAAPDVTRSFGIAKANQTITIVTAAPATAVYNTSFTVAATASSGLPVSIATSGAGSGGGTGSANVLMTSGTGTATVTFTQPGNANYNPATAVVETVTAQ